MDALTRAVLEVGRAARRLGVEYTSVCADRAAGAVVVDGAVLWGHRRLLAHELGAAGYRVEERHLIGTGDGWRLLVYPATGQGDHGP